VNTNDKFGGLAKTIPSFAKEVVWGVTVRVSDSRKIRSSTLGLLAIKWLLFGWVIVCRQLNHLDI